MSKFSISIIGTALLLVGIQPAFSANPPAGRLLAAQCFQCHGTNGKSTSSIDSISGKSANELYNDLIEMKAKTSGNVMDQQAKVYTDAELRLISDYLGSQSSTTTSTTTITSEH